MASLARRRPRRRSLRDDLIRAADAVRSGHDDAQPEETGPERWVWPKAGAAKWAIKTIRGRSERCRHCARDRRSDTRWPRGRPFHLLSAAGLRRPTMRAGRGQLSH